MTIKDEKWDDQLTDKSSKEYMNLVSRVTVEVLDQLLVKILAVRALSCRYKHEAQNRPI